MSRELKSSTDAPDPTERAADATAGLRRRAEERLCALEVRRPDTDDETLRLLHELRVHQIELEIQNEELRQAQESLAQSHARYFDLFDLAPVGYLTIDPEGTIRESNLAAARLLGTARAELAGQPLHRFVHSRDQDAYWLFRRRLADTGAHQTCELRLQPVGGEPRWTLLESSPAPAQDSAAGDWSLSLSDIDALKCAEQSLREEDRRKDRFLAMLGHELRNPLAPIRSVAEILRLSQALEVDQVHRLAEILVRQSTHLARLVDDLLDVARIRGGTMRIALAPCDLCRVAESAAEQVRPLLTERLQALELSLPQSPVMVEGDHTRLAQAIANLLRNASQFSLPGSPISLDLEIDNGAAQIRVQDRGSGIDPELLPRIFDPFVQADQPSDRFAGGLGLGLPLVKGLAQLHGGSVEAQTAGTDLGSTFTLRLPLAFAPARTAQPDQTQPGPAGRSVLVVEDNPDLADACVLLLRILGQDAHQAADGPAALEAVERLRPDLILLDLGLPGMDGLEVARRLRETPHGQAARVVAVTGYGGEDDRRRTREAGCDEHVLKPLGQETLLRILSGCDSRRADSRGESR